MEKFKELATEKQQKIIEAALKCFGIYGYKKASMSDIAKSSGVSKSLLFHYFGTKKNLYKFIAEYSHNVMVEGYESKKIDSYDDLFHRLAIATEMKMGILEKHPHLLQFFISMFKETDMEVTEITNSIMPSTQTLSYEMIIKEDDLKKFKEGVDTKMVLRMIFLISEGYTRELSGGNFNLRNISEELKEILYMIKNNLYKEEYL